MNKMCHHLFSGLSECSSPALLEQHDLELEVGEKVGGDLMPVSSHTWIDIMGECDPTPKPMLVRSQSKDSTSASEARLGDVVSVSDRSDSDRGEEGWESGPERSNATSVIVSILGSRGMAGDAATVCSLAEVRKEEARGDDLIVGPETASPTADQPETVILTKVTINSVTVTFKEARVAEGFFKGY